MVSASISIGRVRPSRRSRGSKSFWNSSRNRRWSWPGAWNTRWFRPHVDVLPDLLDGLVGIGRDDPALGDLLDGQRVGGLLHLDGVVDAVLLLGGQRQRRPEPGVLQRQLRIGIVGDLDLDHPVDVVGVAACRLGALFHRGDQLVLVELLALARGADEPVARAARRTWPPAVRPRRCRSGCRPRERRRSTRPWCGSTRRRSPPGRRATARASA